MTAVVNRAVAEICKSRRRKEDQHLITGHSTYTDNLTLPGMVHLAMLRSPMSHATITSIDVSPALQRPDVLAAFTGRGLLHGVGGDIWVSADPCRSGR